MYAKEEASSYNLDLHKDLAMSALLFLTNMVEPSASSANPILTQFQLNSSLTGQEDSRPQPRHNSLASQVAQGTPQLHTQPGGCSYTEARVTGFYRVIVLHLRG